MPLVDQDEVLTETQSEDSAAMMRQAQVDYANARIAKQKQEEMILIVLVIVLVAALITLAVFARVIWRKTTDATLTAAAQSVRVKRKAGSKLATLKDEILRRADDPN
ncbi:hypothetical protein [Neoaquamicrobium sediminum]|uniref:hypothetical protein n=1 Tax=Neoaquamicrobium sediminum TaxID=1849104 RepID=UPI001564A072|nr:hypothetical protein [Mesorhizobium sediminum]NRC52993.1 hypothetical protein [Mesorhizobium sediminum]